jgi:hypothetical protein
MTYPTDPLAFETSLAERIRNYWLAKGFVVATKVEKVEGSGELIVSRSVPRTVYRIVSDTVNGQPRGMA